MKTSRTVHRTLAVILLLGLILPMQVSAYAAPEDFALASDSESSYTVTRADSAQVASSSQIEAIMSGAWLIEHLASGSTVDVSGVVADAAYGASNQSGYAVWEQPLASFRGPGGEWSTLNVTIRYAISPDGHFYVGSVGSPSEALVVLIGYGEWLAKSLSLRDIRLYGQLRGEYNRLVADGYAQGGVGLSGPLDIQNNYGETIQVLYSAVMMFTTYNSEYRYADRLDVWDPSGPGATSYTGSTWRRLNLSCSGNTHTFVYSHVYNDNGNSTYVKHDGVTVASRGGSIGFNDDIRYDSCPGSVELGGYRTWSEIDSSLHIAVVGGSISSSGHAEYPANGGNPTPSVLTIEPYEPPNNAPELTIDHGSVAVDEGQIATNSGTVNDPDGDPVTLSASTGAVTDNGDGTWIWSFWATDGPDQSQLVTITANDGSAVVSEVTFDFTVNNVEPTVNAGADATIIEGEAFRWVGTFDDPGDDTWTATVDYGDGSGAQPIVLVGKVFSIDRVYSAAGNYVVNITVVDDDGGSGSDTLVVTVLTAQEATEDIIEQVDELIDNGVLNKGQGNSLISKLDNIISNLNRGSTNAAINQLNAFVSQVEDFVNDGLLSPEEGQSLINAARLIQRALGESLESLRSLAETTHVAIGSAARIEAWNDAWYTPTLAREFNMLTPENAMKMQSLLPDLDVDNREIDEIDFRAEIESREGITKADRIVELAISNTMQVRGHTLVWGDHLPIWLTEPHPSWTREDYEKILEKYVTAVVSHYRDRYPGAVIAWDVVNEAIADDVCGLNICYKDNFWHQKLGPEYITLAFEAAHRADPQALLFYNDYGGEGMCGEGMCSKSDSIYALVQGLVQEGVPIHGVGLQMHVDLREMTPEFTEAVERNIDRLAEQDLQIHITEMDVRVAKAGGNIQDQLARQADAYRSMLSVCRAQEQEACTAFIVWGFTDNYSWIYNNDVFDGEPWPDWPLEQPLILDREYDPKPAYYALWDELAP